MRVLILGATGATGREVLSQALERGHTVTVFARHPEDLAKAGATVRFLSGDVMDCNPALANAITGQDAVISTLGVGKSFRSGGLIA